MGNKSSLTYCSVCYDGRYYSDDIMGKDMEDAILYQDDGTKAMSTVRSDTLKPMSPSLSRRSLLPLHQSESVSSLGSVNAHSLPHGLPRSPRRQQQQQSILLLHNQLSFSSQLSMEGRELSMNKRAASSCERDDVEDDVLMQRTESVLTMDEEEGAEQNGDEERA